MPKLKGIGKGNNPDSKKNMIPFKKGKRSETKDFDPRINRLGRPKSFDALRKLVQEIGAQQIDKKGETRIIRKVKQMMESAQASDNATLLKYGWGNVPDEMKQDGTLTLRVVWEDMKPDAVETIDEPDTTNDVDANTEPNEPT